jgi:hypothetical protein
MIETEILFHALQVHDYYFGLERYLPGEAILVLMYKIIMSNVSIII